MASSSVRRSLRLRRPVCTGRSDFRGASAAGRQKSRRMRSSSVRRPLRLRHPQERAAPDAMPVGLGNPWRFPRPTSADKGHGWLCQRIARTTQVSSLGPQRLDADKKFADPSASITPRIAKMSLLRALHTLGGGWLHSAALPAYTRRSSTSRYLTSVQRDFHVDQQQPGKSSRRPAPPAAGGWRGA